MTLPGCWRRRPRWTMTRSQLCSPDPVRAALPQSRAMNTPAYLACRASRRGAAPSQRSLLQNLVEQVRKTRRAKRGPVARDIPHVGLIDPGQFDRRFVGTNGGRIGILLREIE